MIKGFIFSVSTIAILTGCGGGDVNTSPKEVYFDDIVLKGDRMPESGTAQNIILTKWNQFRKEGYTDPQTGKVYAPITKDLMEDSRFSREINGWTLIRADKISDRDDINYQQFKKLNTFIDSETQELYEYYLNIPSSPMTAKGGFSSTYLWGPEEKLEDKIRLKSYLFKLHENTVCGFSNVYDLTPVVNESGHTIDKGILVNCQEVTYHKKSYR